MGEETEGNRIEEVNENCDGEEKTVRKNRLIKTANFPTFLNK